MPVITPKDAAKQLNVDFDTYLKLADDVLKTHFNVADHARQGAYMRADIAATAAVMVPSLVGRVVASLGDGDEAATAILVEAFTVVRELDPILFEQAPSREEYAHLLSNFMTFSTAKGTAERAGPNEARRDAYPLKWKLRAGEASARAPWDPTLPGSGIVGGPIPTAKYRNAFEKAVANFNHQAEKEKDKVNE
ncbi:MAG: hypothetical protein R3D68_07080 [Hyphomicrobiaceae bacterium]